MSKKSKFMTGVAFPVQICDAIRHHIGTEKVLESKRKIAFEDRDAAVAELEELEDHDSPEAMKLKGRHSDATLQIDSLDKQMRFHRNQVKELVEKPDEPKLDFEYEMPPEPAKPKQLKLGEGEKDDRPVGRKPEAPVPVGENQHLAASITELGLADHVCANLKKQGFETVNHLVMHQNKGKRFIEIHAISEVGAKDIEKALSAYLKKHNKAQVDKDLGRGDEQIRNQRGPRVGKGAPVGKKDTPKASPAKTASGKCGKCSKSKGVKWANESKTLCEGCAEKALDGAKA